MGKLILFFFLLISFQFLAQNKVVVVVEIMDIRNSDPVRNAKVLLYKNDSLFNYTSNSLGQFSFFAENGESMTISISHFKYDDLSIKRKISLKNQLDTISYSVQMEYIKEQDISTMYVSAPGVPQVVYGSDRLHVSDFEILPDGNLLLLTYPKRLKKGSHLLIYDGQKVKFNFEVPEESEELIHDYRGNVHIICEKNIFGVHVDNNEIGLSTLEKNYYMKYIAPIVDTNKTKMYFSNFNKDYPAFDYFSFDQKDSTYFKILEIKDDLMMELYRSEYKWVDVRTKLWAKNKELATGIDAEIWVGANYFTQSVYYKELYAPMFQRKDTLFVFDYYKDLLKTFDENGKQLDSIPIFHHYNKRKTGWQKNLIQDSKTGEIYAIFDRYGYTYVGWVNTNTGEITQQVKLEYRYVHDVAIRNNQVYYIYRPYESAQKKYLYKERLPYDFGE